MVIGGTLTQASSREIKRNIVSVDAREVLEQLKTLDVARWTYKHNDDNIVHMGPMAEDFYAAFELGGTDQGISSVDTTGVALAAIKGLHEVIEEKDAKIASMEQRLAALEANQSRVAALEEVVAGMLQQRVTLQTAAYSP